MNEAWFCAQRTNCPEGGGCPVQELAQQGSCRETQVKEPPVLLGEGNPGNASHLGGVILLAGRWGWERALWGESWA